MHRSALYKIYVVNACTNVHVQFVSWQHSTKNVKNKCMRDTLHKLFATVKTIATIENSNVIKNQLDYKRMYFFSPLPHIYIVLL